MDSEAQQATEQFQRFADHEWVVSGTLVLARWRQGHDICHRGLAACTGSDVAAYIADLHNRHREDNLR